MKTRLIRGSLNRRQADDNPELEKKFSSVETLYLVSNLDKEKVQTTNILNGSENYSSKKSVLIRVRWFESIPAHQKSIAKAMLFRI